MSDFTVPVVRIGKIQKHPNADTLSLIEAEGCPVIIRTTDFKEGDLAVYLPIESMIPEGRNWVKEHCSHLKFKNGVHRLRAARLRGVFSMGMVVPIAALRDTSFGGTREVDIGQDIAAELGVVKYEEPEDQEPQQKEPEPRTTWQRVRAWFRRLFRKKPAPSKPRLMPVYEVGHYRKLKSLLVPGEEVVVTEKIHGCNGAFCFKDGELYVSSHRVLRKIEDESLWWRVARQYKLAEKLAECPNHAFYGEVFGSGVQDMEYGRPEGYIELRFFDIMDLSTKEFLSYDEAQAVLKDLDLVPVPELYRGPYDAAVVEPLADGKSTIGGTFREGWVLRPTWRATGRLVLKLVGESYLLRKNPTERH